MTAVESRDAVTKRFTAPGAPFEIVERVVLGVLRYALDDSGARFIVADAERTALIAPHLGDVPLAVEKREPHYVGR